MITTITNAMTVDVEDYFQVSAFERHIPRDDWELIPCRVERNVDRILALFERHEVKATFFTLGWIAERYPEVVRRIADHGHEVASHGYEHVRVPNHSPGDFRADVEKTKQLLEDVTGLEVKGYRAASYSVNNETLWAMDALAEAGYAYSSSIYPIKHDLYGMPEAPRFPFRHNGSGILEVPVTTVELFNRKWPCGGGGYFRLFPYRVSRWLMRRVNGSDGQPCLFYFHPWEVDPEQPRQKGVPVKTRIRHYLNLGRMEARLARLLDDFRWDRMDRVFLHGNTMFAAKAAPTMHGETL